MPARKTRTRRKVVHAQTRAPARKSPRRQKAPPAKPVPIEKVLAKSAPAETAPGAGRPRAPRSYSIKKSKTGTLDWKWAEQRLGNAHNYWVATTRPDRRPHVMPVWGVWVRRQFCFGTDPQSTKGRNLNRNPFAAVHLESGDEAVIVEGRVEAVKDAALRKEIARTYYAKYKVRFAEKPGEPVYAVRPRVAFAWQEKDYTRSATRWRFD